MRIELSKFQGFQTFWEATAQDNLTPEASGRPGTRLELLMRTCSIRFVSPLSHLESNEGPREITIIEQILVNLGQKSVDKY